MPAATPLEVFQENMEDAHQLLALANVLANTRTRSMRRERREAVGAALGYPKKQWGGLDCAESPELFIVIKPGAGITRHSFEQEALAPLLRQAVVAVSAAVETYVADKAITFVGEALANPTDRVRSMGVSFGDILDIEARYTRRSWGYRDLLQRFIRAEASPAPSKIGQVCSLIGRKLDWKKIDGGRILPRGTSDAQLTALYERRNRIAHQADRIKTRKAPITITEVEEFVVNATSIIERIDAQLGTPGAPPA